MNNCMCVCVGVGQMYKLFSSKLQILSNKMMAVCPFRYIIDFYNFYEL